MADIKISQLGAAIAVGDTDLVPIVSGGNTLKATAAQVKEHSIGNTNISSIGDGSVTGAINALNTDKQPKTLDTPLTIGGASKTTVEAALGGLVSENQTLTNALTNKYLLTGVGYVSVTADGTKTYQTLLKELYDAFNTYLGNHTSIYAKIVEVRANNYQYAIEGAPLRTLANTSFSSNIYGMYIELTGAHTNIKYCALSATLANNALRTSVDGASSTDEASTRPASGTEAYLYFDEYTKA